MRCPFLREAQVKSCQASAYRKMIVRSPGGSERERCSTPAYATCPAAKQLHQELPDASRCPFLQESLVQYCSAASVVKYVPYSESPSSRCGSSSYHYCELYTAMAYPGPKAGGTLAGSTVEGVRVPPGLLFTANHMWLDLSDDGCCHIGIDDLLARIVGTVDAITFLPPREMARPTVVLTIRGVDLQMAFPNPLTVTASNLYLRTSPGKLTSDPYTRGWLFEGSVSRSTPGSLRDLTAGLRPSEEAEPWMEQENRRVTEFVHRCLARAGAGGQQFMMDGGTFCPGIVRHMSREETLELFSEFFSPNATLRRPL